MFCCHYEAFVDSKKGEEAMCMFCKNCAHVAMQLFTLLFFCLLQKSDSFQQSHMLFRMGNYNIYPVLKGS